MFDGGAAAVEEAWDPPRGCQAKPPPRPGSAAISSTEFGRRVFSFLLGQLSSEGWRQHQLSKILPVCLGLASVP